MTTRTLTRKLAIPLSAEERLADHAAAMDLVRKKDDAKERKKAVDSEVNEEVKRYDDKLSELAEREAHGFAWADVECREDRDDAKMVVRVTRLDTGEVIDERAYTAEELEELRNPTLPNIDTPCQRCCHSAAAHNEMGCRSAGCACHAYTLNLPAAPPSIEPEDLGEPPAPEASTPPPPPPQKLLGPGPSKPKRGKGGGKKKPRKGKGNNGVRAEA